MHRSVWIVISPCASSDFAIVFLAQNERLRAALETARRRHARVLVSALERAAARRLRTAEADLARAHHRTAELEERLRQTAAEGEAWWAIASDHEATAAGLRATIDQLMQPPPCAEDAQSCCLEQDRAANQDGTGTRPCRECGEAAACVLLLPCRHLCLCAGCDAAVDACPVCAATKNASLHVPFT
jgi:E3 ubiquitin-protein ligase BOI and related proteins